MQNKRTHHLGMSDAVREDRLSCIGGSDARIIMSGDQEAIEALWKIKRGEMENEDLSDVLIVQLGNVTEALNTDWFERKSGYVVTDEQSRPCYSEWPVAMSTLDGLVRKSISDSVALGVFEAKFMLPFYWSMDKAVEKYFPQVQHNMMVTGMERAWLSVITGGGQYEFREIEADPFYQFQLLKAEKAFWDCVQNGTTPGCPAIEQPRVEAVRIDDMTGNNEWANWAADIIESADFVAKHKTADKKLRELVAPEAKEAHGHGIRFKRAKDGKLTLSIDGVKKGRAKAVA